jgi:hypothetical protein
MPTLGWRRDLAKLYNDGLRLALGDTGRSVALVLVAVRCCCLPGQFLCVGCVAIVSADSIGCRRNKGAFLVVQLIPARGDLVEYQALRQSWSFTATRDILDFRN